MRIPHVFKNCGIWSIVKYNLIITRQLKVRIKVRCESNANQVSTIAATADVLYFCVFESAVDATTKKEAN